VIPASIMMTRQNYIIQAISLILLILIMSLFQFCKPNSARNTFVSKIDFTNNLKNQVEMAPLVLKHHRKEGVTENTELKLEFFFYTNSDEKAKKLADELAKLNYTAKYMLAVDSNTEFIITGWTTKIKMSDNVVKDWAKEMCELGYKYDCEFDGWGTQPE
jgi:regulator of RNase E activity RraB